MVAASATRERKRCRRATPPVRPSRRCSRRRSAPRSAASRPSTATARRSSRATRTSASPTRSSTRRSTGSPARCSRSASSRATGSGSGAPNCAEWVLTQFATARIGAILVNINPAYRTTELRYALAQSGCRALIAARAFKTSDYVAMVEEVRPELPALDRRGLARQRRSGTRCSRAPATVGDGRAARRARPRSRPTTRSTSSTRAARPASPKGATLSHRNILNNGYFVGEALRLHRSDRVCIPVPFYHCFGMVLGNLGAHHPRRVHGHPGRGVRAGGDARGRRRRALHEPLRRADDVHRRARRTPTSRTHDLSSLRTGIMAGSPCPVEVMKRVVADMHMDEVTIATA